MAAIEQDNLIPRKPGDGEPSDIRRRSRERLRIALRAFRRLGMSELPKETVAALGSQLGASSASRPSTALIDALEQMSLAITITDVVESLIVHLELKNNTTDSAGGDDNGTLGGDPAFVAGQVGSGLDLDGSGDQISMPSP